MSEQKYLFRREDNGQLVEVSFAVMMAQDRAGYITLKDGVLARRCLHLEASRSAHQPKPERAMQCQVVSDALGFGQHQLDDFEQDRQRNGFAGVEFVRDPRVPEFFQVKCSSQGEYERYAHHRGYVDNNPSVGVLLTQKDLDRAAELVGRK